MRHNNRLRRCLRVRVRVKTGKGEFVKKTRDYHTADARQACKNENEKGTIMSVRKISYEQVHEVGSFFTLGDFLKDELRKQEMAEKSLMSGKQPVYPIVKAGGKPPKFNPKGDRIERLLSQAKEPVYPIIESKGGDAIAEVIKENV